MSKLSVLSLFITLALAFTSFKVLNLIYQAQKVPYIDEIFHVQQAQLYCNNNWAEWNPKITTFPGLYLISVVFLKPIQFFGYKDFCSIYKLRLTNVIATILNFYLSLRIIVSLERKYKVSSGLLFKLVSALNIAIFPPLYFFTFLYYTDVWSTTSVLFLYSLHSSRRKFSKILVGLICCTAVLMRQTNIIWVGLLLLNTAWEKLCKQLKSGPAIQDFKTTQKILQKFVSSFLWTKNKKSKRLITLMSSIISETYHYIIVCLLFIVFLLYNQSIVLGDKTAHTPVLHPMQNFYFLNFAMFFALPFAVVEMFSLWKKPPNLFLVFLLAGVCFALSEYNKIEHPYLLADNRHLAFYVWKRFFGHSLIRRLLVPIYVVSVILFYRMMRKKCSFMFMVALTACIALNLTPQHLFEFRYFIIPFLMWRLQFTENKMVFLETLFYVVVNVFVVYLFLNKPFAWPSEPGAKQRFIW